MNNQNDLLSLKLLTMTKEVRTIYPRMEMQMLQALIFLYRNPDASDVEVMEEVELTQGTVSSMLWLLSEERKPGEPGYGLVVRVENPLDRRKRATRLSTKGIRLMDRLMKSID